MYHSGKSTLHYAHLLVSSTFFPLVAGFDLVAPTGSLTELSALSISTSFVANPGVLEPKAELVSKLEMLAFKIVPGSEVAGVVVFASDVVVSV